MRKDKSRSSKDKVHLCRNNYVLGPVVTKGWKYVAWDDSESDEHIQQTIREAFGKITIITIAHRINTIIDSDKILVMNDGKISEYDTPKNLLSNKDSEFSSLVDDMGENAAEKMRQQAGL